MKTDLEKKELAETTMIILKGLKDAMTYMETITLVFADSKITIEPIAEPCKHEPANPTVRISPPHISDIVCRHCGVDLQASWSEKK